MNSKNTSITRLIPLLAVLCIMTFSSCSNENELVGSWSYIFGGLDIKDYSVYPAYIADDRRPTLIHTINFEKAENSDLGTFTDYVNRIYVPENDENVFAGSTISGRWEIKDGLLHLYYDDKIKVRGATNLNDNDVSILEKEMTERFMADFKEAGANGLPYKIEEINDRKVLSIDFGITKVSLLRSKKEKAE